MTCLFCNRFVEASRTELDPPDGRDIYRIDCPNHGGTLHYLISGSLTSSILPDDTPATITRVANEVKEMNGAGDYDVEIVSHGGTLIVRHYKRDER
jgi:hypothetical protein